MGRNKKSKSEDWDEKDPEERLTELKKIMNKRLEDIAGAVTVCDYCGNQIKIAHGLKIIICESCGNEIMISS